MAVVAALAMPSLAARFGKHRVIFGCLVGMALCLIPLSLLETWSAAVFSLLTYSAFFGAFVPIYALYAIERVEPRLRSVTTGALGSVAGIGTASSAALGGYIVHIFAYRGLFLFAALVIAIGGIIFRFYFGATRKNFN